MAILPTLALSPPTNNRCQHPSPPPLYAIVGHGGGGDRGGQFGAGRMVNKHSVALNHAGTVVRVKQRRWRTDCNAENPLANTSARTLNLYAAVAEL